MATSAVVALVAGIALGVWVVVAPVSYEARASASLPSLIRPGDARRAVAGPPLARRGLAVVAAHGYLLSVRYRAGSEARARRVTVSAVRGIAARAFALAVTRADRRVDGARGRGDADASLIAERAAQAARRATEAAFDVRVATTTLRSAGWRASATAAVAACAVGAIALAGLAAMAWRRRRQVDGAGARETPPVVPVRSGEVLTIDEMRRRLAALDS